MFVIWYIGLTVIITIVAMTILKQSNKIRARSGRTKVLVFVIASFGIALVFTIMSYKGLVSSPVDWLNQPSVKSENLHSTTEGSSEFFGIMFDAGSTGSRIHVFKFQQDENAQDGRYKLLNELFLSTKPGLSAYANDPAKGADSLKDMLEKAKQYIPPNQWSRTVLGLKATAGLRLLSNKTAHTILNEVFRLFKSYPFRSSFSSVSILEGSEEGLFCWFTINFLKGLLQNRGNTVGILDLGGGSTQITYLPSLGENLAKLIPKEYLVNVKTFGKEIEIYTYSYLGLGINSVRFQTFGGKEKAEEIQPGSFQSACLPDKYSGKWKYASKEHNISSKALDGSASRFDTCYSSVKSVVTKYNINKPKDINEKTFYALSYYYDRAVDVKLIDSEAGGQVKVQDFLDAAKKICQQPSWTGDPFLCLDLCYISSLLTDGLGFNLSSTLLLKKKENDIEITWSLGAVFSIYGKFNTQTKKF